MTVAPRGVPPRIGRFRIDGWLGRGGMGTVYSGLDERLDRPVAVKVVSPTLRRSAMARFEREARAMARLSHPNVVRVFEVGHHEGGLFVAMERVRGQTLEAWGAQSQHSWTEVLAVYRAAGLGLVAAHRAGIVHRDFKPSNVMVGDQGEVKVLDFGVALVDAVSDDGHPSPAAAGPRLTTEGKTVGTPAYMAPEQISSAQVDERADQFAFCMSVWEALYGVLPFQAAGLQAQYEAIATGPPDPPRSTAVPPPLAEALRRGLAFHPSERWPSMVELLDALDVRRRDRGRTVAVASAVAAVLVAAGIGATRDSAAPSCSAGSHGIERTWNAARRAQIRSAFLETGVSYSPSVWAFAERRVDAFAVQWAQAYASACEETFVQRAQPEAILDLRMSCLQRARSELDGSLRLLREMGAGGLANAHEVLAGLPDLSRCDADAVARAPSSPESRDAARTEVTRRLIDRSATLRLAGRSDAAWEAVAAAFSSSDGVGDPTIAAELDLEAGRVLDDLGRYAEARDRLDAALRRAMESGNVGLCQLAATELLGVVGLQLSRPDEALERYQLLATRLPRPDAGAEAHAREQLGAVLRRKGDIEFAESELRRALALRIEHAGEADPPVGRARDVLATILAEAGKLDEAEVEARAAVRVAAEALGQEHPNTVASRANLAGILIHRGRYHEAEEQLRWVLAVRERRLGPSHPDVAQTRSNLGTVLSYEGKLDEALEVHRQALADKLEGLGPEHPSTAASHGNLAQVLEALGRREEMVVEQGRALEIWSMALGPRHPQVGIARMNLAAGLMALGRDEEAELEFRAAERILAQAQGADGLALALSRTSLAQFLLARGRPREALAFAERGWQRYQQSDTPAETRATAAFTMARALWGAPTDPEARQRAYDLSEVALAAFDSAESGDVDDAAAEVRTWQVGKARSAR